MTPAQRYAFGFRSWYIRKRYDFTTEPRQRPLEGSVTAADGRTTDWPWTHYERAGAAAWGRLRNGGRA